jgi:CheY-like chemotaxis protein
VLTGDVLRIESGRIGSLDLVDPDGNLSRAVVDSEMHSIASGPLLDHSQSASTFGGELPIAGTIGSETTTPSSSFMVGTMAGAPAQLPQAQTADKSDRPVILIVDDSTANRKMTRRLLRHVARDILEAGDGRECLTVYQETLRRGAEVHIILLDDHMPNLSGPETARILRFQGYEGLICGVTGNTLPSDIKNFKDNGASCVLSKPLNIDLLKYYISQYKIGLTADP